jgi:pimeloyl-ACP methyl ester carboxylesterase
MPIHPLSFLQPRPAQPNLPLFVFFPGMDGTGRLFEQQIASLAAKFDVRCLAIAGDDLSDWNGLVDRSIRIISAELSPRQDLYFCGESFGACLAMQVAAQIKTKINELVLVNPASSFGRLPWLAGGSVLSRLLPDAIYPLSARILANFLINVDRVAPRNRQNLVNAMLSVQPQAAAWRLDLLRQFQVETILPALLDIPILLIAGELDRLLPSPLEVRILGRLLPKSKTILLPYSGHACLLERDIHLVDLL